MIDIIPLKSISCVIFWCVFSELKSCVSWVPNQLVAVTYFVYYRLWCDTVTSISQRIACTRFVKCRTSLEYLCNDLLHVNVKELIGESWCTPFFEVKTLAVALKICLIVNWLHMNSHWSDFYFQYQVEQITLDVIVGRFVVNEEDATFSLLFLSFSTSS